MTQTRLKPEARPPASKPVPEAAPAAPATAQAAERARRVEVVLQQIDALPTLSPVAARLMAMSARDDGEFDEIIRLIELDPALTGRILALCRRASTGVAQTVTTVRRAAVLLGLEAVQSAVLSVQVYDLMSKPPGDDGSAEARPRQPGDRGLDRDGFWRHSLAVACCAELLANEHREHKVRPDEAFTAGLLHDLGKIVLDWVLPHSYTKVLELAEARRADLATIERAVLGVDHRVAGKRLAEHWGLPHVLQDAMWLCGQPARLLPELPHRKLITLVTAADAIVRLMHLGWSGEHGDPPSEAVACQEAMLDPTRLARVQARLHETLARRCADLGLGTPTPPELMMQSLAAANGRLARLNSAMHTRTEGARHQARVLDALGAFAGGARPGSSVTDVLGQISAAFNQLAGRGFTVMLYQAREGDAWRISRHSPEGALVAAESLEAPKDHEGRPVDLASLSRGGDFSGMIGLLTWLSEHLARAGATGAAPDMRRLRFLPLVSGVGPAAAILHDRVDADILTPAGARPLGVLAGAWAWAVASATQHQGARRLSEELAITARTLSLTQEKLTEAESMARLGELTAGAAHEMNNPLTIISGRGQLLAARLTDEAMRAQAEEITGAATRLTDMISALHLLARPPTPHPEACALADLLPEAARRAKAGAKAAAQPMVRVSAEEPIALISVDREMFTRALAELIENAIESGHPASTPLELRASLDPLDGALVISVRDQGGGLSDHAQRHAFDPFFSEKSSGRQTGLGLSIARRLIELHGGRIELAPIPGGTQATLRLPTWRHGQVAQAA